MHQSVNKSEDVGSEARARLDGLLAILRLPPLRGLDGRERARVVEVLADVEWRTLTTLALEDDHVTFFFADGLPWRVRRGDVPPWRVDYRRPRSKVYT